MRGIAALGVVFFHFGNGTLPTLVPNSFGSFFEWARLGIPGFFIISGFVIPYAMYTAGYSIGSAGRFFLKRMVRMAPPAYISILIIVAIYLGAVFMNGKPIEGMIWPGTSFEAIAGNLLFSYSLFNVEKFIEVYWTLEVEFQFYILIAFLLPLILKYAHNQVLLSLILIAVNATFLFNNDRILFFKYNAFFILGILLFLYRMNLIKRNYFIYASGLTAIACYAQLGIYSGVASVIGIFTIAFVRFQNPVTNFLGLISFSLYITHHNSGVVAEFVLRNLSGNDPSEPVKVLMFLIYLGIAIAFAWVFYKLVEEPFLRLSKRISVGPVNKKND
ncbi:MAG: acyltransferase [Bacteroidota bacterium]|nr:acyltransferase [Bacteroidota bacterium]